MSFLKRNSKLKILIPITNSSGMTLIELVISIVISAILIVGVTGFVLNILFQYDKQKEGLSNNSKALQLCTAFNIINKYPEVYVKGDNSSLKVMDNSVNPAEQVIFYNYQNCVYQDVYNGTIFKTNLLGEDFSILFSTESDPAYLKDILKIEITDKYDQKYIKKVSIRDCDTISTY